MDFLHDESYTESGIIMHTQNWEIKRNRLEE